MISVRILLATAAFAATISLASARDINVEAAVAVDGKVECFADKNWLIAILSGRCDTFTPPIKVAVGEFFIANGKRRRIGIIVGSQADQDMLEDGLDVRKGEWTCVAAESLKDVSSDENKDSKRTWLFIRKCQPVI
jgi:hypothetical protein